MENYKFNNEEFLVIRNCIQKIKQGLSSVASIQPLEQPTPIEHDNFIYYRIGLLLDVTSLIDCAISRLVDGIKVCNGLAEFNSLLFPSAILMRIILRRICDLAFLWKKPENTIDYRDHQNNNEPGEWAKKRLGITYKSKTEQGIILVLGEIYGIALTNDVFRKKSEYFNDIYYGKNAIERYMPLFSHQHENDQSIKRAKGNIIQCVIDCYEYVDLILKGFQKYEQVKINNRTSLNMTIDTTILRQLRSQYLV